MRMILTPLLSPLASILILTLGNGFFTTITSLQLAYHHASQLMIGFISATYFIGLVYGSMRSQYLINRIGHIRSYAFFTATITAVILIQGMYYHPWLWAVLRLIAGYTLAGFFIVIESWLVAGSEEKNKGLVIGIYLCTYYIAQAISQLFMKIPLSTMLMSFVMIAILASISSIPICLTRFTVPQVESPTLLSPRTLWRKAPLGLVSGFISGALIGVLYTIYPVFLLQIGQPQAHIATLLCLLILGGASLQLPIGKLSDLFDRRVMIGILSFACMLIGITFFLVPLNFTTLACYSILLGAAVFTIYPLSISHTSDYVPKHMTIPAISVLTLFYGTGSVIGPLLAGPLLQLFHNIGFYVFLVFFGLVLGVYTIWRIRYRPAAEPEERASFTPAGAENPISPEEIAEQLETNTST